MAVPDELKGLRFACECVSARGKGYSDPWANIAQNKLLPNGTKEEILNLVAQEPKTISQLAEALELSPPSIHTHINDMMKSELLRESEDWEKLFIMLTLIRASRSKSSVLRQDPGQLMGR